MSGLFKIAGRAASKGVPSSLGRIPYVMALEALQLATRTIRGGDAPKIWARNSFVLGTLHPLVSDLDITVWFEGEPSRAQLRQLARVLRWAAHAFPFLGEANVYAAPEARALEAVANPFELARDPGTSERLRAAGKSARHGFLAAQGTAFILRMLEGDIRNVLHHPESRRAKWDAHYEAVAHVAAVPPNPIWRGFPERTLLRGIVETAVHLLELADPEEMGRAVESLERYFECVGREVPVHALGMDDWWWALLPHRFCFGPTKPPKMTGPRADAFVAQLCWEVWGILAQYRLAPDLRIVNEHLAAVGRALEAAAPERPERDEARTLRMALERLSKSTQTR